MVEASSTTSCGASDECLTPICVSSFCIVRTSFNCGTLVSFSGSADSSDAHSSGSAAFLAPEMTTSPARRVPPSMTSLSTWRTPLRHPFLGRQRRHRQRMHFLAHALAEGGVDQLVAAHARLAGGRRRYDQRLEVRAVAADGKMLARKTGCDRLSYGGRRDHAAFSGAASSRAQAD